MPEILTKTVIFEKPGKSNTSRTLEISQARASELNLKNILVATTMGDTGLLAAQMFRGCNVVVITHSTGFREPNMQEVSESKRKEIEAAGAKVLTCQHALGGVNRAVRRKFETYQLDEIIAHTLRTQGQGMKVVYEIALMAADAGLSPAGEAVLCIAGTGRGADTAVLLQPAHAHDFFDIKLLEILCHPAADHPGFH
ncbi:MAG: hypothetical protein JEZ06_09335 [Anaerolineaceae bacterium]|nr:hypothetical protein [Anaerolineaceae bacterium]